MTGRDRDSRMLRAAALLFVALLSFGCAGLWEETGSGRLVEETVVHTVGPGETLASIADDYYGEPGAAEYLARVNGVPAGLTLDPGTVIDVPVSSEDLERYRMRTEAKSHYNRGTALASAGELARSEEAFREALELDPRFADAAYNLGVVLLARGESNRAVLLLEQTASVRPEDAGIRFALGKALSECGRHAQATDEFRRAVRLDPSLEEAAYALGLSLLAADRREEGIVALDAYLRRFPEGQWAREARSRLARLARENDTGEGEH